MYAVLGKLVDLPQTTPAPYAGSPHKHQEHHKVTQSRDQNVIWLTQEAYDKLHEELENLRGPVRSEVVARLSAARDEGDLKENGGYQAAKDEQGKTEARIRQLEEVLRLADTRTPADDGIVGAGKTITTRFSSDSEADTFLLAAREMEDTTEGLQVFSPQSPLGSAILGARKGDTVTYDAPNGKELKVEILDAVPYPG